MVCVCVCASVQEYASKRNVDFVCLEHAVCECDPLFQCCCSFAAVHIMSSHLLLSHSVSLFFPPLISLLFFLLLPAAHKTELKEVEPWQWHNGFGSSLSSLPVRGRSVEFPGNAARLNTQHNISLSQLQNHKTVEIYAHKRNNWLYQTHSIYRAIHLKLKRMTDCWDWFPFFWLIEIS